MNLLAVDQSVSPHALDQIASLHVLDQNVNLLPRALDQNVSAVVPDLGATPIALVLEVNVEERLARAPHVLKMEDVLPVILSTSLAAQLVSTFLLTTRLHVLK